MENHASQLSLVVVNSTSWPDCKDGIGTRGQDNDLIVSTAQQIPTEWANHQHPRFSSPIQTVSSYCYIALGILSLIFNTVNIIIMRRQKKLSPYIYLTSLAACDFLTGGALALNKLFCNPGFINAVPRAGPAVGPLLVPLFYVCNSTLNAAAFLVNALSLDRLIAIKYPMHRSIWCSTRRAYITSCFLIIFGFLIDVDYFARLVTAWYSDPDTGVQIPFIGYTEIGQQQLITDIVYYMKFALKQVIPLSLMIATNSLTLKELALNRKFRNETAGGKTLNNIQCLRITVGVIVIFVVTNIPRSVYLFNVAINGLPSNPSVAVMVVYAATEMFLWTNICNNFIIYTVLNARFRHDVIHLLQCKCSRNTLENPNGSSTDLSTYRVSSETRPLEDCSHCCQTGK